MDWWRPDFVYPLLGALLAGCAVGYEREYRARAAGFRTHALVALTSALLMLAAQHQVEWSGSTTPTEVLRIDPVRMAHGILTGIGFLCGGVIFREGASVHGLTTAASLWATSGLGILFGVGFYGLAIGGTVLVLLVLTLFRLVDRVMPGQAIADVVIELKGLAADEDSGVREALSGDGLHVKRMAQRMTAGGHRQYSLMVVAKGRLDEDALARKLRQYPHVDGYSITLRNA